ncbi:MULTISPECIES: SRPBCC family protein [Cupriavidus]|uniref:SRPBCC family protein n=1 Tax=Cupriavidus sp. DF5525 TaxID=3160989 RepID=UPI0003B0B05F|nr:vanillate O-demethylase oxidoreductase VanB [Ralstonia pickettii DTP0602]
MPTETDRIERSILIEAPVARVWHALTDADTFGSWFGVKFDGVTFAPGQRAVGSITYPGYEYLKFDVQVERMEPEKLLSWRWHPAPLERGRDYSDEPATLVEFTLREVDGGTMLTVVESGFDQIPPERRMDAFRINSSGWDEQVNNVRKHLTGAA